MPNILDKYKNKAKKINTKIIYDEISDNRIIDAVIDLKKDWFNPVVVWTKENLEKSFWDFLENLEYHICAKEDNPSFVAWNLLSEWKVDGFISWAVNTTWDTLRVLFKTIWVKTWVKRVSGFFLMNSSKWLMIFADCAVQPNPSSEQLAEIAYLSVLSAKEFDIEPKVAMLSFSTLWSSSSIETQKVIEATKLLKEKLITEKLENVEVMWEVQLDAAIDKEVALKKIKDIWTWTWWANVLIFPDLNSGNIGYKLVQYFAWAEAIWPILQWFKKPANDLSRWCSIEDIKNLHYLTVLQTKHDK